MWVQISLGAGANKRVMECVSRREAEATEVGIRLEAGAHEL